MVQGWRIKVLQDGLLETNGTIKIVASRHISNTSIIIVECMTLRDDILVAKNNEFLNLEIEDN